MIDKGSASNGTVVGVRRVRGRLLSMTLAVSALALGGLILPAPASATPGDLAGTWTSVDLDGSNQTLRVKGAGKPVYAVFLRDDFTTGACGGPAAKVVGRALSDGSSLSVRGTLVCLHGGNPIPGVRVSFHLDYDADAATLTDEVGVVWTRAS